MRVKMSRTEVDAADGIYMQCPEQHHGRPVWAKPSRMMMPWSLAAHRDLCDATMHGAVLAVLLVAERIARHNASDPCSATSAHGADTGAGSESAVCPPAHHGMLRLRDLPPEIICYILGECEATSRVLALPCLTAEEGLHGCYILHRLASVYGGCAYTMQLCNDHNTVCMTSSCIHVCVYDVIVYTCVCMTSSCIHVCV